MTTQGTKPTLKKIRTGAVSRGLSLARLTLGAGARAAGQALKRGDDRGTSAYWVAQARALAGELGKLKGTAMKVGQGLSMYGEHLFPPEVNAVLKSLQQESPPLAWPEIEKVLKRQLPPERLDELEIEPVAWASASLGQVHRARVKATGEWLALKIQYPGVDLAIDGDLKLIRGLLSASKLLPGGHRYDDLFAEIRDMLHQEIDYRRELELTREYAANFSADARYVVPRCYPEYSTRKVLATSFERGVRVDDPSIRAWPLERRNALSRAMLELYLSEVFRFGMVQTDPHFGNYLVRPAEMAEEGGAPRAPGAGDQIVLLDFGAVRKLEPAFLKPYRRMVRGAFHRDLDVIAAATDEMGFTRPGDSDEIRRGFAELCMLMLEPFADHAEPYRWHGTDLPNRAMKGGMELSVQFRFRPPPREIVFLDRKLGGVFIWIAALGAEFRARELLESALTDGGTGVGAAPTPASPT